MTLGDITSNMKLGVLMLSLMKSPEEAIIKIIDEFSNTDNLEIQKLKETVCSKLECDDVTIEPGDECVYVSFHNIKKSSVDFVTDVILYVLNIVNKLLPFISVFAHDVDVKSIVDGIALVDNEGTMHIEIPMNKEVMILDVKYDIDNNIVSIEIPVKSEKVLEKLREMKVK